jgi:DNA primase
MADEPVLCFDGDGAGRRAAYRAIDVALPLLQPGKSLRFALLPQGQDPDDLARAGGHPAIATVIGGAKPLADLLWAREADAAPLDTPERRAALESRLRQIVGQIRDETLRRHYLAEVQRRLTAFLPPTPSGSRMSGQWTKRRRQDAPSGPLAQMAAQSQNGGVGLGRTAQAPREALIVLGLMAHPPLLAAHCDALAHLEFLAPEAREIAQVLVDCAAGHEGDDPSEIVKAAQLGRFDAIERLKRVVDPFECWALAPEANPQDVDDMLRQAMALHHRFVTLNTQLREAERALAEDMSEANLAWLKDVRSELSSLTGAEADIDGFGGGGRRAVRRF